MNKKISFFLDSGAFSAWSKGIEINIRDYIKFIKENINYIDTYAVLDDIQNPDKTLENQKIMEEAGLKPLPCYHYGEDIKYLEYYLKNYEYIAFGGMVPISTKDLIQWLDNLFSKYICNSDGYPKIKIHGFGLTTYELLLRYPWYSVDSASWLNYGIYGWICMPPYINGRFEFIEKMITIAISNKSSKLNKFNYHYFNMIDEKKEIIDLYIKEMGFKIGKSEFENSNEIVLEEGLCNSVLQRSLFNIKYYEKLQDYITKNNIKFKYMGVRSFF